MEFLETLENVRREAEAVARDTEITEAKNAGPQWLAEHQGERFGDNLSARNKLRRDNDASYMLALGKFAKLLNEARGGSRLARYALSEAMTTSDFPYLFGDVLDRQMLGNYREWPRVYPNFMRVARNVPDFRDVYRFAVDGAEGVLSSVPELDEYQFGSLSETRYNYAVAKYGRKMAFSWESIINDDFDSLAQSSPRRLGRAARRTENKIATQLYVDSTGPHASLYTSGNTNIINTSNGASEDNPALDITALQDAMIVLGNMLDADSEPIMVETIELVVPPALEVTAMNMLNATDLNLNAMGGDTSNRVNVANWMRARMRLSVDPYIPVVASSSNGNTSWFLFAGAMADRPACEIGLLRGHNEPELFVKEPNARRVGGGMVNPLDGDFESDATEYKVRHVVGGTQLDGKSTVASNGSGA